MDSDASTLKTLESFIMIESRTCRSLKPHRGHNTDCSRKTDLVLSLETFSWESAAVCCDEKALPEWMRASNKARACSLNCHLYEHGRQHAKLAIKLVWEQDSFQTRISLPKRASFKRLLLFKRP